MDFIDDVDFELALAGGKPDLLAHLADVFHACVGRGIDLDEVDIGIFINRLAMRTLVTGSIGSILRKAVVGFGQQPGGGCLTRPSRA